MNNPELYAKNKQITKQFVTDVLKNNVDKFKWRSDHRDTLIDIGSGPGDMLMEVISPLLPRKFQRIVCSDVNPRMVEYARTHYRHLTNSEFRLLDIATELELPQDLRGQFDHVVSFVCLQLVKNQRKAFQNIYQLMRPEGGDCLLNIFARSPYFDAYLELSNSLKWSQYMSDVNEYTSYWHHSKNPEEEARLMLENCGFLYCDVNLYKKSLEIVNVDAFKVFLFACSPYVHHMPTELHQEFMDELVEAISNADQSCAVIGETGEKFRFNFELLVIFARR